MVRLYVGGLAEDVTAEQLAQRFRAFGTVRGSQVQAPKANDTMRPPNASCRGFGYVDLDLADEAALRKVVSVYNGSKWRGQALKVQLARPDYLARLREEWAREKPDLQAAGTAKGPAPLRAKLTITAPDGTEVEVAANKKRTDFPNIASVPLAALSWEGLPPTPALLRKRAFVDAMEPAYAAASTARQQERKRARQAAEEPDESEELAAVDFMDGEITAQAHVDLSRFSDSDDEQHPHTAREAAAMGAAAAAAGEDEGEADALWEQQGGITRYLAALEQEHSGGEAKDPASRSSADSGAAASSASAAAPREDEGASQSQGSLSEGSGPDSPAANTGGGEARFEEQLEPSVQSSDSSAGSMQGEEAADGGTESPSPSSDAEGSAESRGEEGAGDADDSSHAGDAHVAEPEPDWAVMFAELEAGCQFWARGTGAQELEAQWRASRRALAAEWKSARRDALRRAPAARRGSHKAG